MTSLPDATSNYSPGWARAVRYTRLKNGRIRGYLFTPDGRRRQVTADTVEAAQQQLVDIISIIILADFVGLSEKTYREHLRQDRRS